MTTHGYEQHQTGRRGGKEYIDDQEATKIRCHTNRIKKINFQLELRNRFETLQELDDIDTMMVSISDMIQQSASRVPKAINKPRNINRGYHHQHEPWWRNDEKWQKTATINNEQGTQKYARPSKRKQERTSGNTTKRSYEKQLWHQRAWRNSEERRS